MMTEGTQFTEAGYLDQDFSSDEKYGEADNPPWVDRVQLRHGMDWLDLILRNEADRDAGRVSVDNSLIKRRSTINPLKSN